VLTVYLVALELLEFPIYSQSCLWARMHSCPHGCDVTLPAGSSNLSKNGRRLERRKLKGLRSELRSIDSELIRLLTLRMQLAGRIGFLKWRLGKHVIDTVAERLVVGNIVRTARRLGLDTAFARRVAALIIEGSVEVQLQSRPTFGSGTKVGVIGAGAMGTWFARFFASQGDEVIVADHNSRKAQRLANMVHAREAANNVEAALGSDIIVLATPPNTIDKIVEEILPAAKREALLIEICAVKSPTIQPLRVAERHGLRVASIHPMFGPLASTGLRKRRIIFVRSGRKWKESLRAIKRLFPGAEIFLTRPDIHDKRTAVTLALPHFLNMAFANAACRRRRNISGLQDFAGRTFSLQLLLSEIIANDPETIADIQIMNKQFGYVLRDMQEEVESLATIVKRRDRPSLVAHYRRVRRLLTADPQFNVAPRIFEKAYDAVTAASEGNM
jgi:prephenate dehydrogenase/chorismate mutase